MSHSPINLEKLSEPLLIIIAGPTAVGKTALSIRLAKWLDAEIVSADARQFFKEMEIGTAKPSKTELEAVKHHFINCKSITENYSAGDFERDADIFLENYFKTKKIAILCGGSGLYIKAVLEGLDEMPSTPPQIREKLIARLEAEGLDVLANELLQLEPNITEIIDIQNPQRVVRALEVNLHTGQNFGELRKAKTKILPFQIIKIGLELPREQLYGRINARVDDMIANGLVKEVEDLREYQILNALQTVGYSEIFSFLNNEITLERTIELIKQNTRRYAKRQMTWFKNKDNFAWFNPGDFERIKEEIGSGNKEK
jgi:tRNA dimethylallyltransferase